MLSLLSVFLLTCGLPALRGIENKGRERSSMPFYLTLVVSATRLMSTSRRDIGQSLRCLLHPNTCKSYLVYRTACLIDGILQCWPIILQHNYDIIQTRNQVAMAVTYHLLLLPVSSLSFLLSHPPFTSRLLNLTCPFMDEFSLQYSLIGSHDSDSQ